MTSKQSRKVSKTERAQRKAPTVGGLFSGVRGIELGFMNAGFDLLWSNDIDEPASRTFSKNFSHKHIVRDVKKLRAKDVPPADILVGFFPCRAFSIAGYRKGFEDDWAISFFKSHD